MDFHLEKDIATNNTRYFFSLLGPRFETVTELMAESLSKRFGFKYKPIYVFSCQPNKHYVKENYIVLNKQAISIEKKTKEKVIYLQEYEDLNKEFINSPLIKKLTKQLIKKQGQLPIYPFTTSFLKTSSPGWLVLGPATELATCYDNKIEHYKLFKQLNLPRNKANIFNSKKELLKSKHVFPCYITASYTSGGNESGLIYNKEMLLTFLSNLRVINKNNCFLAASIFENIITMPNVNAIITGKNETKILVISDQIMRGNRYLGNVYPSSIPKKHTEQIKKITVKLGNYLSKKGYRGLFGCDFLINDHGKLVIVDLNPRRQGGYACNALALKSIGINITDIELSCALGEKVTTNLNYKQIQYPNAWAHSKVKPHDPGQYITKEVRNGNMLDIFSKRGGNYLGTFYNKKSLFIDGYIGYVVSVGKNKEKIYNYINNTVNKLLIDTLS